MDVLVTEVGATSTTAGTASDELRLMAEAVRSVMNAESSLDRVAAIADGLEGFDEQLWRVLASELGVTGLLVPEQHGGLGLSWREARVVLDELGRGLACVPYLSSCVVAVTVILSAGDAAAAVVC